jgi:hypothetical protein
MDKNYTIRATVTLNFAFELEAESETAAKEMAAEHLAEFDLNTAAKDTVITTEAGQ